MQGGNPVAARISLLACLVTLMSLPQVSHAEGIFSDGGPDAGTPEYYEYHAGAPVGARQHSAWGKLWPPFARPTGHPQLCIHKYHTSTYWPWPYICQDRSVVYATSFTQIANGWGVATTFYDYHFDPQTNLLNSSGRRHLAWVLSNVPEQYQRASISSVTKPEINDARLASVQAEVSHLAGPGHTMPIALQQSVDPAVRSAEVVEQIHRGAVDNMMPPVIQYTSAQASQ